MDRQVEEISPSGTKRQIMRSRSGSPSKSNMASESRVMNPFDDNS